MKARVSLADGSKATTRIGLTGAAGGRGGTEAR